MIKVITYGTYDLLHYGHILLLERAKELGDYLIVGVTSDDFDKARGKINVKQSLMERIEAVKQTGIPDEVIVEEYEGQKIDDILRYDIDIFTVGSDWEGHFDYLQEYCKVIYLPRTEGLSSTDLRSKERTIKIGLIGDNESRILNKYCNEYKYVNGAEISGVCTSDKDIINNHGDICIVDSFQKLLEISDAVYILSHPRLHYDHIKEAILKGKHVLVELPVALSCREAEELYSLAKEHNVILMPAMKTAYATAYNRLLLLIKSGKIGKVVSVDATCTSIRKIEQETLEYDEVWNSMCAWGPTALLPVFHVLGCYYKEVHIYTLLADWDSLFDSFSKVDFVFDKAVASIKVGRGAKSEGELIISGTDGYVYVPAPWWKTDYFELRYENAEDNRRYFYQLDGEGIRYEIVAFLKAVSDHKSGTYISQELALSITKVLEKYYNKEFTEIG